MTACTKFLNITLCLLVLGFTYPTTLFAQNASVGIGFSARIDPKPAEVSSSNSKRILVASNEAGVEIRVVNRSMTSNDYDLRVFSSSGRPMQAWSSAPKLKLKPGKAKIVRIVTRLDEGKSQHFKICLASNGNPASSCQHYHAVRY